jgi:hypothetical protein
MGTPVLKIASRKAALVEDGQFNRSRRCGLSSMDISTKSYPASLAEVKISSQE